MLKLSGLTAMLVATQTERVGWLRDRTRLYHEARFIGRWSMIDIFMESLLGALVVFGSVITIEPGVGAVAFCDVAILTMFYETIDKGRADGIDQANGHETSILAGQPFDTGSIGSGLTERGEWEDIEGSPTGYEKHVGNAERNARALYGECSGVFARPGESAGE